MQPYVNQPPLDHSAAAAAAANYYSDPSDSCSGSRTMSHRARDGGGGELHDKQLSTSDLMMAQLEPFLIKPGELPGPESFL